MPHERIFTAEESNILTAAGIELYKALHDALGPAIAPAALSAGAADYLAAWPYQDTKGGESRAVLLIEQERKNRNGFKELLDFIRRMGPELRFESLDMSAPLNDLDMAAFEQSLSLESTRRKAGISKEDWDDMTDEEKGFIEPTPFC